MIRRISKKRSERGEKYHLKRSAIRKKPRKPGETLRIYGPPARRKWMKTLPCSACGVVGYSEGAHVLGNGGMSRKADADTQAPLCHTMPVPYPALSMSFAVGGCHILYDEHRSIFDAEFPNYDPEIAARTTNEAWVALSEKSK